MTDLATRIADVKKKAEAIQKAMAIIGFGEGAAAESEDGGIGIEWHLGDDAVVFIDIEADLTVRFYCNPGKGRYVEKAFAASPDPFLAMAAEIDRLEDEVAGISVAEEESAKITELEASAAATPRPAEELSA